MTTSTNCNYLAILFGFLLLGTVCLEFFLGQRCLRVAVQWRLFRRLRLVVAIVVVELMMAMKTINTLGK